MHYSVFFLVVCAAISGCTAQAIPSKIRQVGGEAWVPPTESVVPPSTVPSAPSLNHNLRFTNSVSDRRADPGVLRADGQFYLFVTNHPGVNVPTAQSADLVTWTSSPNDALPMLPEWASPGKTWAPEVTQIDADRYVMYFCAKHTASGKQCVGSAVARSPLGPYVPTSGAPLACQTTIGGDIDPSPFVSSDGNRWVVFKNDGNCCGNSVHLWLQAMQEDGVTPFGAPIMLLGVDQPWEGNLIEAPFLWYANGTYYLFYSANFYGNAAYAIGYATSQSITGPYVKFAGPWVASSDVQGSVLGPGGQIIVTDDSGAAWMVYHQWADKTFDDRVLNLAPITWSPTGPRADVQFGRQEVGPLFFEP